MKELQVAGSGPLLQGLEGVPSQAQASIIASGCELDPTDTDDWKL